MDDQPTPGQLAARDDMIEEAHRIIDEARSRGITLRLFGGLAVRSHCELVYVCERDYSDIDLIGLRRQANGIVALFVALGFAENVDVGVATDHLQLQFVKECAHAEGGQRRSIHPDDHVDLFLDTFRMDHNVPLADRLEIEDYTIALSDVLLTKLQTARLDDGDERDIVSLLAQSPVGTTDEPGVINIAYIARLCSGSWGLAYDVLNNIVRMRDILERRSDLEAQLAERVRSGLDRLEAAIEAEPKSAKWKLRARVGTHWQWHEPVEDQHVADPGSLRHRE